MNNLASPTDPERLFQFNDDIRSAMIVDRIGNVVSFASRTRRPVDPAFVKDIASKWVALLGGMLRGSEASYGVLEWLHLRYGKLHVYCWLVDSGYLVFTSRSQLDDSLLHEIGTSSAARARYADQWGLDDFRGERRLHQRA
jgi:hypothetical protein